MQAKIAVIGGDGIGPDVTAQAQKVLEAIASAYGHQLTFESGIMGGCAIDELGTPLPDETLDMAKGSDAVLFGAVGGPKWSDPSAPVRPEQGLLKIRKELGLFANLRPVKVNDALLDVSAIKPEVLTGTDMLVIRELTGGIYFGERGRKENRSVAYDTMIYTTPEIERVVRMACEMARQRRGKVTSVDKANVLEVSRLWREVATRVFAEYPDLETEHILVDAATMHLIRRPADFDVIVTGNMFGDIITDEASMLAGSMGMLPSASLAEGTMGLYEPIHGTAPDIAGQGIANPIAAILSAAMLLRMSLGLGDEAAKVEAAVDQVLAEGYRTKDLAEDDSELVTTDVMGDLIAARI